MHAFIIEDEYLIGQSLRDMLENLGFKTFTFARSEDAAVIGAKAQRIDLITADVRLLPGDGVRAVETICRDRDIPVVFITGYADELKERAPEAVVVQKPVKPEHLEAAVANVLRKRQVPADAKSGNETIEKIRQLAGLRDEGLLTEEEFQAKKKELLAAL
jgi:DNA-binding response OmpR family regulator